MENIKPNQTEELSAQELDNVAGGALSAADAFVDNLQDDQLVANDLSRDGIGRKNLQRTDDFQASLEEFNQTGDKPVK